MYVTRVDKTDKTLVGGACRAWPTAAPRRMSLLVVWPSGCRWFETFDAFGNDSLGLRVGFFDRCDLLRMRS
jgi:hypothetical protein